MTRSGGFTPSISMQRRLYRQFVLGQQWHGGIVTPGCDPYFARSKRAQASKM
jgi:hypothetical protein